MSNNNSKQHAGELKKIYKYISVRVEKLRIENEVSKAELARLLGVSRNHATDMMDGGAYTVRTLYLFCHLFKCKVEDLFPPQGTFKIGKVKSVKVREFRKYKLKIV